MSASDDASSMTSGRARNYPCTIHGAGSIPNGPTEVAMPRHGLWILRMIALVVGPSVDVSAQEGEGSATVRESARTRIGDHRVVRGRVKAVHAPRLFTVEERAGSGRDVLVIAPDARATPAVGAAV